jgi:beta-glucanase (GH16 family)
MILTAFFSLLAAAAADPQLSARNVGVDEPLQAPVLVWSDEFNGRALDLSKWSYDTSRNKVGWFNKEKQYYSASRPENLRLKNGHLIIEARHDPKQIRARSDWGGQQYSSGKITTKGKAEFQYGFVEVRAKLPCTGGTWPAIWMMPVGPSPWPTGGEIDIMEHVGSKPHIIYGTVHTALFNHMLGTQRGADVAVPTSCSAFHRYQLLWRPDSITIGVDDHAYMRVRNDQPGGRGAWPFDSPFYLILNFALGGDWAGAIDDRALPQRFEVDYVRVWKLPN